MTCKDCVHYDRCAWFADKIARNRIFIDFNINVQAVEEKCQHFNNKESFIELMPQDQQDDNVIKALNEILEKMLVIGDLQQAGTISNALDFINRQKAEIEELVHKLECLLCHATGGKLSKHTYPLDIMYSFVNDEIQDYCEEAQSEAVKEFAERLKKEIDIRTTLSKEQDENILFLIDNLLKEMGVK